MKFFYPFIYKKKDKNEPIPMQIELIPPTLEEKEDSEDKEESDVIVIDII